MKTKSVGGKPIIKSATCGFGHTDSDKCSEPNQPGIWTEGGSYMCPEHEKVLKEIRRSLDTEADPYATRERAAIQRRMVGLEDDPSEYENEDD